MKAAVYTKYGGPEVLQIQEIQKPVPKEDEVLVRVNAVSLNDWDWGLLNGDFINRMMFGISRPKKTILGSDIAGTIESVGKAITKFKPGDSVYGDLSGQWGGLAEYVCAPEKSLSLKPPVMNFIDAASIPQVGMLAVQALIDKGKLQPGQKLLINGAGGGVGTIAVQIAKTIGVEVTGIDSSRKLDMMRSIGFDHVIDYQKEDFSRMGIKYDLILDVKSQRSIFDFTRVLNSHGVYVTVGGSMSRLFQALFVSPWISLFSRKHIRIVALKLNKDLPYMNQLYVAGKLRPVIDGPYKLEDVAKAFERFGRAEHLGKIVIEMEGE